MSLLDDKAAAVCAKLENDPNYRSGFGADPAPTPTPHPFLDLIREILQALLPTIIGCFHTPAAVHKEMQRPSILTKLAARRQIRHALAASDDDAPSIRMIQGAVFAVGKDTTADEYAQLTS